MIEAAVVVPDGSTTTCPSGEHRMFGGCRDARSVYSAREPQVSLTNVPVIAARVIGSHECCDVRDFVERLISKARKCIPTVEVSCSPRWVDLTEVWVLENFLPTAQKVIVAR